MRLLTSLAVGFLVFLALLAITPVDNSDTDKWTRSGMTVSVDAKTGCEYFTKLFGGITPRLNADGTHMGCKK